MAMAAVSQSGPRASGVELAIQRIQAAMPIAVAMATASAATTADLA